MSHLSPTSSEAELPAPPLVSTSKVSLTTAPASHHQLSFQHQESGRKDRSEAKRWHNQTEQNHVLPASLVDKQIYHPGSGQFLKSIHSPLKSRRNKDEESNPDVLQPDQAGESHKIYTAPNENLPADDSLSINRIGNETIPRQPQDDHHQPERGLKFPGRSAAAVCQKKKSLESDGKTLQNQQTGHRSGHAGHEVVLELKLEQGGRAWKLFSDPEALKAELKAQQGIGADYSLDVSTTTSKLHGKTGLTEHSATKPGYLAPSSAGGPASPFISQLSGIILERFSGEPFDKLPSKIYKEQLQPIEAAVRDSLDKLHGLGVAYRGIEESNIFVCGIPDAPQCVFVDLDNPSLQDNLTEQEWTRSCNEDNNRWKCMLKKAKADIAIRTGLELLTSSTSTPDKSATQQQLIECLNDAQDNVEGALDLVDQIMDLESNGPELTLSLLFFLRRFGRDTEGLRIIKHYTSGKNPQETPLYAEFLQAEIAIFEAHNVLKSDMIQVCKACAEAFELAYGRTHIKTLKARMKWSKCVSNEEARTLYRESDAAVKTGVPQKAQQALLRRWESYLPEEDRGLKRNISEVDHSVILLPHS